jgi:predicted tellurium resistance membrane protein TerC
MDQLLVLAADPSAWLALATLAVMEVVLGVDNLVFIALLSSRLPPKEGAKARRIGIGLSLLLRLVLVTGAAYAVRLTAPLFTIFTQSFSYRDLILILGGSSSSSRQRQRFITPSIRSRLPRSRGRTARPFQSRPARSFFLTLFSQLTASLPRSA